jgi:uracil-DNA glycosylase
MARARRDRGTSTRSTCPDPRLLGAECDACPLSREHGAPVRGEGPMRPVLAIVGEAPGLNETREGHPFIGKSGELLEKLLENAGVFRVQTYIDNALLCMPPGGDLKEWLRESKRAAKDEGVEWRSPIDCCRSRLLRELGVPKCSRCEKWQLGPRDSRCNCAEPQLAAWAHRTCAPVLVPMGNAALQSLLGLNGITSWRGSPIEIGGKVRT